MFRLDAQKPVHLCDGLTRRDFLHAGSLSMLGLTLPGFAELQAQGAVRKDKDVNCIMLFLLGAPSQLDTWDMKPDAPAEIRGPFHPIKTNVPGMEISEIFPRMAKHADKFSILRSVYHTAAAVHDTGHQMMQTGRLFGGGLEYPHIGCVLDYVKGPKGDVPAHVLLPRPMGATGGNMPHGQSAGFLGKPYDPFVLNADPSDPKFKVPDLLAPDYISAVREDRRRRTARGRNDALRHSAISASSRCARRRGPANRRYGRRDRAQLQSLECIRDHEGGQLRRRIPRGRRPYREARLYPRRRSGAHARRSFGAAQHGG